MLWLEQDITGTRTWWCARTLLLAAGLTGFAVRSCFYVSCCKLRTSVTGQLTSLQASGSFLTCLYYLCPLDNSRKDWSIHNLCSHARGIQPFTYANFTYNLHPIH